MAEPGGFPQQVEGAKRRKIRKGTTSCWECKRRKTRCSFATPGSRVCEPCQQRGKPCFSQQYDDPQPPRQRSNPYLTVHHQGLTFPLPAVYGHENFPPPNCSDNPLADDAPGIQFFDSSLVPSPGLCSAPRPGANVSAEYLAISQAIHPIFPSQRDADLIIGAGNTSTFLQFFTLPYIDLFSGLLRPASDLSALPGPDQHPVLLARTLLYLANGLQALDWDSLPVPLDLESTSTMSACAQTYVDTASRFVTNSDDDVLMTSLESLECLVLQGVFYINSGNLRRSWLLFRRALALAQLMHLDTDPGMKTSPSPTVLDSNSLASPAILWYRIVGQERYLSLILGMPSYTTDYSPFIASMPDDCSTGLLERQHCIILGQMASRQMPKQSGLRTGPGGQIGIGNNKRVPAESIRMIRKIDQSLQDAAMAASDWWLLPRSRLRNANEDDPISSHLYRDEPDAPNPLHDVMRIMVQITHYNLIILLHLPSILIQLGYDSSSHNDHRNNDGDDPNTNDDNNTSDGDDDDDDGDNLSRVVTCITSSRELLQRYVRLRCMKRSPFCCRFIDFAAFTASAALVIAHMGVQGRIQQQGHQSSESCPPPRRREKPLGGLLPGLLTHMRLSDFALVQETADLMGRVDEKANGARNTSDKTRNPQSSVVGQAALLLRQLADMGAAASSSSSSSSTSSSSCYSGHSATPHGPTSHLRGAALRMHIPFYTTIHVTVDGISIVDQVDQGRTDNLEWMLDIPLSPSMYALGPPNTSGAGGFGEMNEINLELDSQGFVR